MVLGDIVYIVALILFIYLTFGIIRNYYKSKFDDDGHRIDMQHDRDKENKNKE
jgi:hypothetical protein